VNTHKNGNDLRAMSYEAKQLFSLTLQSGELHANDILRLIPGRRLVVAGIWQGKTVVAKLFLDKRHAKRHADAELAGIKLLQERNIPSPKFYGESQSEDGCVHALIFEWLEADIDFARAWHQVSIRDALLPLLKALVIEVATQHVFGLTQRDLHLNNFLFANSSIWTLDAAQIESHGGRLPKKQSMDNLALLFSQLGADSENYQEILFKHYVNARGWAWKQEDLRELYFMTDLWGKERWKNYERKIFRNSTHFISKANWASESVCDREFYKNELMGFINNPEYVFSRTDVQVLKKGRSSTVIRVSMDGHDYVIKRYNIKNWWHWMRRCLRTTRAKKCWRIAQKLRLFGIHTARPVAYIENNIAGVRGKSYFVTEYVTGSNVNDYLQQNQADNLKQNSMVTKVCSLLSSLKKMAITHGDLKMTNLLVSQESEPVLIDLDGACEHRSVTILQRTSKKEWQRFLRNFDGAPSLRNKFTMGRVD